MASSEAFTMKGFSAFLYQVHQAIDEVMTWNQKLLCFELGLTVAVGAAS